MEILVTGHDGYIGSELVAHLTENGHSVTGFDKNVDPADDIRDYSRVDRVFDDHDFDLVYHLAAEADVWVDDWRHLLETNVFGAVNVISAAEAAGIPVVFASSVAASGEVNRYGYSKNLAEKAVSHYDGVSIVRFPNVTGGDAPRGQAQDMVEEGLDGEIEVWDDGKTVRSYVDVSDLCVFLGEIGTASFSIETPAAVYSHTTDNSHLGEIIQAAVAEETGEHPELSIVDRSPPSPRVLTAEDIHLRDSKSLGESIRSQVRSSLSE